MTRPKSFTEKVYEVVGKIPRGKVMTYKEVAKLTGRPGAFRAVGTAMKNNKNPREIPCHRVVGSLGKMHGYAFGKGEATKINLLKKEGVLFLNKNKVDLKNSSVFSQRI